MWLFRLILRAERRVPKNRQAYKVLSGGSVNTSVAHLRFLRPATGRRISWKIRIPLLWGGSEARCVAADGVTEPPPQPTWGENKMQVHWGGEPENIMSQRKSTRQYEERERGRKREEKKNANLRMNYQANDPHFLLSYTCRRKSNSSCKYFVTVTMDAKRNKRPRKKTGSGNAKKPLVASF